ncbi:MAG TPA: acetyl-CoA C-acyltransferase [Acidimicrobiales bacterium]|nr:acetyl-CoA C-acyltransferase [Acidimicrobiales bacterium]MDP6287669.1 acetyl-CoA C-acyltransferase [Acidimicrobiales bacterium]HJM73761.1 acetyl-CoA C-acyltransferase [Acidimicrobiales bacterium]
MASPQTRSSIVILAGARTPMGRFQGGLSSLTATDLGAGAIAAAIDRSGITPEDVDFAYLGNVVAAGVGQVPARRAAADAGIPLTVPSTLLNRACLSGLHAIHLASQMIRLGEADTVVAGGMESMTNAPYLLTKARSGYRIGDGAVVDSMMADGLTCTLEHCAMGEATERYASELGLAREPQDAFAAASHERAARAQKDGLFATEIVPVSIPQRRGEPVVVSDDEGIRTDADAESMGRLPAAFAPDGNLTAGNASQISDGAAACIVTTMDRAEALGIAPLAEVVSHGQVAGPDASLLHQPSNAISVALDRAGLTVADMDLLEINEAFAAVALASMDALGVTDEIVNVNGGAIALGHPIGMSGTRIALTLAHELARRGGGLGAAGLCGGGGQGEAMVLRVAA